MNQILSTNNNNNNNGKTLDTRRIIVVFCAIIILFALVAGGVAAYNLYKSISKDPKVDALNKPEVSLEEIEDGIAITAKYEEGISKIIYTWNDTETLEIAFDGKTMINKLIDVPEGAQNELKLTVVGLDGKTTEVSKTVIREVEEKLPTIEWNVTDKINIMATDETGISYVEYEWEGEEAVRIAASVEEQTSIQINIEVKRGTNKLKVVAVNVAGKETVKEASFIGVVEPEISAIRYGDKVKITVTHDMGFKKVEYIINGTQYVYDETISIYDSEKTEITFEFPIKEGQNIIKVTAYSLETKVENGEEINVSRTFEGKATYNP